MPWLRDVSVLGVRSGDGPQGLPVNKSARAAGVTSTALSPSYALEVVLGDRTVRLTRDQLLAMPQVTEELPIACVEGWSASGTWTGVRVKDLLAEVGAGPTTWSCRSLQTSGPYRTTLLPAGFVANDATLLALQLDGEDLLDRPRLPGADHRPEPPRRAPDQVGRTARGGGVRARLVLGGVGVLLAAYGVLRLLELGWDNLVATVVWLAGGVLVHDAVLAPSSSWSARSPCSPCGRARGGPRPPAGWSSWAPSR